MPSFEQKRATDLSALAQKCLDRILTEPEEALINWATNCRDFIGPISHIRTATIDANFIRWLASDINASAFLDAKGIKLLSTSVQGDLDLDNCRLTTSLTFHACDFNGEIRLDSTVIKNAEFRDCTFQRAIRGGNATVQGSLYICDSVMFDEITLGRIVIAGDLSFAGLDVQTPSASICLDGAKITGNVLFTDGFKTKSSVQLHSAKMGDLNCCGAVFSDAKALFSLDGVTINGDLSLSNGFSCRGEIRLPGAHILGNMECINAEIGSVTCHNMIVDADLMWVDIKDVGQSRLSLVGVKVKGFRDQRASWPKRGNLDLEGFVYEQLTVHADPTSAPIPEGELPARMPFSAIDRIEWINLQSENRIREPQPWMQLAKIAQGLGDDRGARHVAYRLACTRAERSPYPIRLASKCFAWLREQPFRIAWSIGLILFLTTALFWWAGSNGAIAPREKDTYNAWAAGHTFPVAYPKFNPLIYSLENELPLVKLGQDDKWAADPSHHSVSVASGCLLHWTWIFDSYGLLIWVRWLSIVLGWVQATVLAAALTTRLKA
jgi:hypothetical protein